MYRNFATNGDSGHQWNFDERYDYAHVILLRDTHTGNVVIISERAKRASSVMFVFNRDFRYVYIYIYIYICGRTSTSTRMPGYHC